MTTIELNLPVVNKNRLRPFFFLPTSPKSAQFSNRTTVNYDALKPLSRSTSPLVDISITPQIISPEQIKVSEQFIKGHPLYDFITKPENLSRNDLEDILSRVDFGIKINSSGSVKASDSEEYRFTWIRDTAIIADSLDKAGYTAEAVQIVKKLNHFYASEDQRTRFLRFILYFKNPKDAFRDPKGEEKDYIPHVRAGIDNDGEIVKSDESWGHRQLDALGEFLHITARLANEGKLDLKELDKEIIQRTNSGNSVESHLSLMIKFLNRIEYWDQKDFGAWESHISWKRASSVAACLSACIEFQKYFSNNNWNENKGFKLYNGNGYKIEDFQRELKDTVEKGKKALNERIPIDGSFADECDEFHDDAALAFILKNVDVLGLNENQEKAILKTVYRLMGEVGFKRRHDDDYMGSNYVYEPNHGRNWNQIFSNGNDPKHKPAEWSIFDAILSQYYFNKYIKSSGGDENSLVLADKHMKRALAQITKKDYLLKEFRGYERLIPAGIVSEAWYYDSGKDGVSGPEGKGPEWRPNRNSPLNWSHAEYASMFEVAMRAMELKENL